MLFRSMRMLLGRGRPLYREVILGKGSPREVSSGLHGNAILLAQPTTGEIRAQLPPPRDHLTDNIVVVFTTDRQDVRKAKDLEVSRGRYSRCAELRKEVCYAFADVEISKSSAEECLPEQGVPDCLSLQHVAFQRRGFSNLTRTVWLLGEILELGSERIYKQRLKMSKMTVSRSAATESMRCAMMMATRSNHPSSTSSCWGLMWHMVTTLCDR